MKQNEKDFWIKIATRVRHYRRSQNMPVQELADAVGVVRTHIVRFEAGLTGLSLPRLIAVAKTLNVDVWRLLSDEEPQEIRDANALMLASFREKGLSEEEIDKVLEYMTLLERGRNGDAK